MHAELYIRRLFLALIALLLIVAGLGGNLGSMLAALIDTQHVQEGKATTELSQVIGVTI